MKGKFITIEGCEGSGKSTQIKLIKEYFDEKKIPVIVTREPGGVPLAEKIRPLILGKSDVNVSPLAELLLYTTARAQHIDELIRPALKSGKTVICDRFTDSTLAYQGYARGLDKELIKTLNDIALGGLKVDTTIFLDISPDEAFARKGGWDTNDRIESEALDFHQRVYDGFRAIAAAEPNRVKVIDARDTAKKVFEKVIKAICACLV
ncbi:MAG: dTMP kinase [Firmicutes bacterium]|nr:dTMP kinase [Bacillota bacterium]